MKTEPRSTVGGYNVLKCVETCDYLWRIAATPDVDQEGGGEGEVWVLQGRILHQHLPTPQQSYKHNIAIGEG